LAGSREEDRVRRVVIIEMTREDGPKMILGFSWSWLWQLGEWMGRRRDSVVGGEAGGIWGKRGAASQTVE
jgi:hypothetical protein